MTSPARVFLDTSALFAGIWSAEGGGRLILTLGEIGAIDLLISPHILRELEGALRRKAPTALAPLALLLDRARVEIVESASTRAAGELGSMVGHPADTAILADALAAHPDYFVTLDREHFLDNLDLRDRLLFSMGTPGDFLAWYRKGII